MAVEDLANTPAERAAAAAAAAGCGIKRTRDDVQAQFAEAPEVAVGGDGGRHVVIIGAGLVGSLAAVALRMKGFDVHVYERYPDIRSIPSTGRSINLSVTSRGLRAVKSLGGGVYEELLEKLATKVRGRIIHMPDSKTLFQRYGKDDSECNYSVSRVDLNKYLIDLAAKRGAEFHFNHLLSDTSDFKSGGRVGCMLHFTRQDEGLPPSRFRIRAACPVIGCDGGGSRVRYAMRESGLTEFTEDIISRGYKEVLFPNPGEVDFGAKGEDGGEACHGRYGLHIWPRGEHMLMALANVDGSFTGTIYMDNKGEQESFEAFANTIEGRAKCAEWCQRHYPHALKHVGGIDDMVRQIVENPTGILGTVSTSCWAHEGKVVLIGDACHAMVPFFGQGCNCGFEDALWLSRLVDKHCCREGKAVPDLCTADSWARVFSEVEAERKPNADAICAMALENFAEMRDKSGDVRFQAMKRVENKLENTYPALFRSRYAMVCYGGEGNVSYANARALGEIQGGILERLCEGMADEAALAKADSTVDLAWAKQLIEELLVPQQQKLGIDLSTVRH